MRLMEWNLNGNQRLHETVDVSLDFVSMCTFTLACFTGISKKTLKEISEFPNFHSLFFLLLFDIVRSKSLSGYRPENVVKCFVINIL